MTLLAGITIGLLAATFYIAGRVVRAQANVISEQKSVIASQRSAIEELQEAVHLLAIGPDERDSRPDAVIH